jgi:uracil phosphoribosyltransferase
MTKIRDKTTDTQAYIHYADRAMALLAEVIEPDSQTLCR